MTLKIYGNPPYYPLLRILMFLMFSLRSVYNINNNVFSILMMINVRRLTSIIEYILHHSYIISFYNFTELPKCDIQILTFQQNWIHKKENGYANRRISFLCMINWSSIKSPKVWYLTNSELLLSKNRITFFGVLLQSLKTTNANINVLRNHFSRSSSSF